MTDKPDWMDRKINPNLRHDEQGRWYLDTSVTCGWMDKFRREDDEEARAREQQHNAQILRAICSLSFNESPQQAPKEQRKGGKYDYGLMEKKDTYLKSICTMRDICKRDFFDAQPKFTNSKGKSKARPLTAEETMEAMLDDYFCEGAGKDQRRRLWQKKIDTCTAIVYKSQSTKFKIVSPSEDLILITEDCLKGYLQVNYDKLPGIELDSEKGVFGMGLYKAKALKHDAWLAAAGGKGYLLREYCEVMFALIKEIWNLDQAMAFGITPFVKETKLHSLVLSGTNNSGNAIGYYDPNNASSFVRRKIKDRKK